MPSWHYTTNKVDPFTSHRVWLEACGGSIGRVGLGGVRGRECAEFWARARSDRGINGVPDLDHLPLLVLPVLVGGRKTAKTVKERKGRVW